MQNEWIRILDRVPNSPQEVIIYFKNETGWKTTCCYWDGENFVDLCERCHHNEIYTYNTPIAYWIALPEKPQNNSTVWNPIIDEIVTF